MARRADPERRAFWRELIENQAASGFSVLDFCLKRGVSTASFYSWKRRLGADSPTRVGRLANATKAEPTPPSFIAIDLPALSNAPPTHCEVLLLDGRRVRVPAGFDRDSLVDLFAALGASR